MYLDLPSAIMVQQYALSIKQPWATLLVHGLKTIEVRSWRTARRGRVLIHAARIPDERPEAWSRVPPQLQQAARQVGGVLGSAVLTDCRAYRSLEAFCADRSRHLNEPSWFRPPLLYGFTFTNPTPLPFVPCPGQTRFFLAEGPAAAEGPQRAEAGGPRLMVSVRGAAEVEAALAGGAALIDVKEPLRGSLGRADDAVITEVARAVRGRAPVSAALGEWRQPGAQDWPSSLPALSFLKWGLAGCGGMYLWKPLLRAVARNLTGRQPGVAVAAAAYADWRQARAPQPDEVCAFACEQGVGAFLLDTWAKDGKTLLDWVSSQEVAGWCARCRAAGVPVALAGSLGPEQIQALLPARPTWFAVRGAACAGGRRDAPIDASRVRRLAELMADGVTMARRENG
jgi:uncharacterized protein (UPF0264 family)